MQPAQPPSIRIAGPFTTALGAGDSLQAQNTRLLVDGTIAQANDVGRQYYLDINSTATPSGTLVIQPAIGPGRWIQQAGGSAAAQGSIGVSNASSNLSATLDGAANFHLPTGEYALIRSSGPWSLDTATGIATWNGDDNQKFLVSISASMFNTGSSLETSIGMSVDGSIIPFARKLKTVSPVDSGSDALFSLTLVTMIELDNGVTVQVQFAGQATTLTITNLVYTLTPLS